MEDPALLKNIENENKANVGLEYYKPICHSITATLTIYTSSLESAHNPHTIGAHYEARLIVLTKQENRLDK